MVGLVGVRPVEERDISGDIVSVHIDFLTFDKFNFVFVKPVSSVLAPGIGVAVDFDGHVVVILPDDLAELASESSVVIRLGFDLDLISNREEAHYDPSSM